MVEGQPPPPRKQALAQDGEGKQLKIGSCISRIGKTLGYLQGRIFMRLYPHLPIQTFTLNIFADILWVYNLMGLRGIRDVVG